MLQSTQNKKIILEVFIPAHPLASTEERVTSNCGNVVDNNFWNASAVK